ncbi:hypothetical protein FisN_3Lu243 [Fistulifera solaris]|uniref:USP domain-containing protein n=1 Tax=Fistulifera solaris TaxID=1519565 RepID=A0A1Z5JPV7_FISSO|nr:hypothetical protein FisN_3Lu243 [Fistulifera solaris]|eukprot:GAX15798.1 hypothetical protein FisN_3Lu243 [Fistulifera solaris]
MEAWPVRGIANPNGTSCHVGSALLLLKYCLEPLASQIVADAAANAVNDDVVHVVGQFVRHHDTNVKLLFDTLRSAVEIEARDLGDVITTFMKLINYFCQLTKGDDDDEHRDTKSNLASIWNQCCNAGKVHSVLLGNVKGEDGGNAATHRKETKPRCMPVPFRVNVSSRKQLSLIDMIRDTLQPQVVKDYVWENQSNSCVEIQTSRTLVIDNLPPVWLLHIDWFAPSPDGENDFGTLCVPSKLMTHRILDTKDTSSYYELIGGVLLSQVHDEEITDERDRRHYIPLISKDSVWYMLDDDEEPQEVSEERCLELFGGVSHGEESPFRDNGETVSVRGYLLVYRDPSQCEKLSFVPDQVQNPTCIDWTLPVTFVGRRLRVQWAKGKRYDGVVTSYNETTGKHQIRYDDGDVKEYVLWKKTIEWL